MVLLPKGRALIEDFPIGKLKLPDALDKLKNGKLTGYAVFDFLTADCVLFYEEGRLIGARFQRGPQEFKDADALTVLVDQIILSGSGSFHAYSFSKGTNLAILSLECGDRLISQQKLVQSELKVLLEKIRNERLTSLLRITASLRVGMILYHEGTNVGFSHDGAPAISSSSEAVQQIAALPEAMIDLFSLRGGAAPSADLSYVVNIRELWESAMGGVFTPTEAVQQVTIPTPPVAAAPTAPDSSEIESALLAIAQKSLGKLGKSLVEKELVNVGGIKALKQESTLNVFLNGLEKNARLLASANKLKEMRDAISEQVAKL